MQSSATCASETAEEQPQGEALRRKPVTLIGCASGPYWSRVATGGSPRGLHNGGGDREVPIAGTDSCDAPHFQYHVSGQLAIRMDEEPR